MYAEYNCNDRINCNNTSNNYINSNSNSSSSSSSNNNNPWVLGHSIKQWSCRMNFEAPRICMCVCVYVVCVCIYIYIVNNK